MFSCNRAQHGKSPYNQQLNAVRITSNTENIKLMPEYHSNGHLNFINNFGLSQQIIADKKFVDINSASKCPTDSSKAQNSCYFTHNVVNKLLNFNNKKPNFSTICGVKAKSESESIPQIFVSKEIAGQTMGNKQEEMNKCKSSSKSPKKQKINPERANSTSKHTKKFQKQSKRESDRSCNISPHKRKNNKMWHKQSLKMEIMETEDIPTELESPIITHCSIDIPPCEAIACCKISSPLSQKSQQAYEVPNSPLQCKFRARFPSECESEDSFIVFDYGSFECDTELSEDDEESSDSDSTSDEDGLNNIETDNELKDMRKTASPTKQVHLQLQIIPNPTDEDLNFNSLHNIILLSFINISIILEHNFLDNYVLKSHSARSSSIIITIIDIKGQGSF